MGIGEATREGTRAAAEDRDGHGGRRVASGVGSHWHGQFDTAKMEMEGTAEAMEDKIRPDVGKG